MSFLSFYGTESLTITITIIFETETTKNVLNNKNVIYIIRYGRRKKRKRKSVNLFVVIVAIRLDDVYLMKFLVLLFLIFVFRFIVITLFSVVAIFTFLITILFVRTMFKKIYIAFKVTMLVTTFVTLLKSLKS